MAGAFPSVPLDPLAADDPRELGGFRLLGRLGSGGMGVAYLAEGPDGWAVVKSMWPQLRADPGFRARLAREIEVMRGVDSPGVVRVLADEVSAGESWFAMDFVPGVTLRRRVEESGPLPPGEVRQLAAGLAGALGAVHAAGVVHRDLKPANVMLSPSGPVLIDFGVAQVADATQLTQTGLVVGSAGWLAPEQITGDPVSAATDTHAWALCVLFAATGRAPFGGENTASTIYQVLHDEPQVPESLGQPLASLVRSALSKDPAARPSATSIRAGLGVGLPADATVPGAAPAATRVYETVAPPPPPPAPGAAAAGSSGSGWRRPLVVALAVVGVLALAGGAFALGRGGGPSESSPAAATGAPSAPASASSPASSPAASPATQAPASASASPAPVSPKPSPTRPTRTPTPTPASRPISSRSIIDVSVSTDCPNSFGLTGPELLVDGDTGSGWRCDDRPDNSEGNINSVPTQYQTVDFFFDRPYTLTSIELIEGAASNAFRWCENGRLREVQWDFHDGQEALLDSFPDREGYPAGDLFLTTRLGEPRTTDYVSMTVLSIYPAGDYCTDNGETGRPWEYGLTAKPSEVRFFGYRAP